MIQESQIRARLGTTAHFCRVVVLKLAADLLCGVRVGLELVQEQLLRINVNRFRGGLVFNALRLVYHSTLGLGVIKKKKRREEKDLLGGLGVGLELVLLQSWHI